MVYPADADLLAALNDSHSPAYRATAYYGSELTIDVPLTEDGNLDFDMTAQIQGSGRVYASRDSSGVSYVPKEMDDPLACFGQEIAIDRIVRSGDRQWEIPLGRFPIQDVPDKREYFRRFPSLDPANPDNDRRTVVAWDLQATIVDRFDWIRGGDFLQPTSPISGNTTWQEIQRLSPVPIAKNIADQALPASLAYSDSRFDAIVTLFDNLGAEPAMNRQGALTGRVKDRWLTATVSEFKITGTVDVTGGMSNAVYNAVRARSSAADSTIVGIAQILDAGNALRVGGPFNGGIPKTYGYASPLLLTQGAADAAAATILQRVSTRNVQKITVTCLPNPLLDLGDWGTVIDGRTGETYTGEISAMHYSLDPRAAMTFDLIVSSVS